MKDVPERMSFLERHGSDAVTARATLTAPPFLAMVRSKVEGRHLPAEIVEAKTATANALQEAEQGWRHANDMIAARGGLEGADSSWSAAA